MCTYQYFIHLKGLASLLNPLCGLLLPTEDDPAHDEVPAVLEAHIRTLGEVESVPELEPLRELQVEVAFAHRCKRSIFPRPNDMPRQVV